MFSRSFVIILFFLTPISYYYSSRPPEDKVISTKYFDFHSNFWVNLYHFIYIKAGVNEGEPIQSKIDKDIWNKFSDNEKITFQETLQYFKRNIISKDLRTSSLLFNLKQNAINFGIDDRLVINTLPDSLINTLNNFKNIFRNYFWEKEDKQNRETLNKNLKLIKKYEERLVKELRAYTNSNWQKENIRVDISYYSKQIRGRNTAYTTVSPETHVSISSLITEPPGSWFEILFHESSHHLIHSDTGFIGRQILKASEETGLPAPRSLWHAILFYISGRLVQNILKEEKIPYEIYMVRNKVFTSYYPYLKKYFESYINKKEDFKTCVEKFLTAYNKK